MKKHHKKGRTGLFSSVHKYNVPVLFGLFFGLIAVAVGLSQIFAASQVTFILSPSSQAANTNDNKSINVSFDSNGQQVDGGTVKIVYDSSKLSFVSFTTSTNPYVRISNKVSSAGSYSFDFLTPYQSQDLPLLGTITLKAGTVSNTQPVAVSFDAAGTQAYLGFNPSSRTYYPVTYAQAAIVINGTALPNPNPTPNPTPTPRPGPSPSPSPTSNPTSNRVVNPNQYTPSTINPSSPGATPETNPNNPTSNLDSTSPDTQASDYLGSSSAKNNLYGAAKPKRKSSLAPFLIIGGTILLLGSAAVLFVKYRRKTTRPHGTAQGLHSTILGKDALAVAATEENVVVHPDTAEQKETKQKHSAIHEYPHIIMQHAKRHHKPAKDAPPMHAAAVPALVTAKDKGAPQKPAVQPTHEAEQTVTKVKESTDKAHHKEVEVDIVRLKPAEAVAAAALTDLAAPKPHLTEAAIPPAPPSSQSDEPARSNKTQQPAVIPPLPELPTAAIPTAPSNPLPTHVPKHSPPPAPGHHIPDWQTQVVPSSRGTSAKENDPPDMFELAQEHPETYGSYQALEVEDAAKTDHKKDTK